MKKIWVAGPAIIAAPLLLAVCVSATSTPSSTVKLSGAAAVMSKFAVPASVSVSSVAPTWATVRFVLPSADTAAASEEIVVYPAGGQGATKPLGATVAGSPVTLTGLRPSTSYHVEVSVSAAAGHAASEWTASSQFTTAEGAVTPVTPAPAESPAESPAAVTATPAATPTFTPTPWATSFTAFPAPLPTPVTSAAAQTPTPTSGSSAPVTLTPAPWPTSAAATATSAPTSAAASTSAPSSSAPSSSAAVPYAAALSSYNVLAQSYSATDIINGGWAQDANDTAEGGEACPVANTSYSSALDAVVLTTDGLPATGATTGCGHIRSQYTVPTSGDVVEAEIWLPSLSSAAAVGGSSYPAGTLLDWASMWTDGAGSTNGTENWPADTELDAVETQYGANYISVHYGSASPSSGSTGNWTTAPQGWGPAGTSYAASDAGAANVQPGWNVVDIEFTSTDANIYVNGALFVTVPGSVLSHDPAYLDFGISGPNGYDPNYASWPAGPATEDVKYVKVFS